MDSADLLSLAIAIDRYFRQHRMHDHHRLVQALIRELCGRDRGPLRERDVPWTEVNVVDWGRVLGLRDGYPRQSTNLCPSCGALDDGWCEMTYPDGWVMVCRCGARWVIEATT